MSIPSAPDPAKVEAASATALLPSVPITAETESRLGETTQTVGRAFEQLSIIAASMPTNAAASSESGIQCGLNADASEGAGPCAGRDEPVCSPFCSFSLIINQ